jgi:hypothetical protein
LKGKRYLIHDRDPLFTAEFLSMLAETGVASLKRPPRSPNLSAHAERFVLDQGITSAANARLPENHSDP